jgi:hypothetical protein
MLISTVFFVTLLENDVVRSAETECLYGHSTCSDAEKEEVRRVKRYDKPVQKDPLGNALVGGGVSGVVKGSVATGVSSAVKDVAIEAAKKKAQDQ